MADEFDFKGQAKVLLKQLGSNPGEVLNQGLALAAVETALREAYERGKRDARSPGARAAATPVVSSPSFGGAARPAARAGASIANAAAPGPAPECPHEWEEAFLDGRALGYRCVECGMLQKDVQDRCDHYFVQTGAGEVCVACRKPRRSR